MVLDFFLSNNLTDPSQCPVANILPSDRYLIELIPIFLIINIYTYIC